MENFVGERWFFYQDAAGLWKWARLDVLGTILAHSGASFDSRDACLHHARQSGYADQPRGEIGIAAGSPDFPAQAVMLRASSTI
jgi:hypothetical protein